MLHLTDINEFEAVYAIAEKLPENERVLFKAMTGEDYDPKDFLVALADIPGEHHVIWAGEKPVAAGGFIPQRPGVFRTWFMAPDDSWKDHGREITGVCRERIAVMLDGLAHRIETVTLADRAEARAWYERIGLAFETIHRGYGANGEDAVMYVAVRGAE
jgi:hypothetical protein